MTWWSWILIWGGLTLALIAMVALIAWWLFRKFMTLLDDLGELADRSAALDPADAERAPLPIAVLAEPRDIQEREAKRKHHRTESRRARHAARIDRARAITRLDPTAKAALVSAARERWSDRTPR